MKRRHFIKYFSLGIGTVPFIFKNISSGWKAEQDSPNFLFIIVDDLATTLGCYNKAYVKSPNIDLLAKESVQFNHAYCQEPICAASRASLLTGLRPETVGVEYPYSYYFVEKILPKYGTFPDKFASNGSYVHWMGKVHHGFDPLNPKVGFLPPGDDYYSKENIQRMKSDGSSANIPPFETTDLPEQNYYDFKIADQAIRELTNLSNSKDPFCLAVGFKKPHLPFTAPRKYLQMYDDIEIPLPENPYRPEGCSKLGFDPYHLHQYRWEHDDPDKLFSDEYTRTLRKYYFGCITFVDAQIGKLIRALQDYGMRDNTVIVLTADHGFNTGELNHWGKATLYEESVKVPLLISDERSTANGRQSDELVELVDLMPTMLDIAGFTVPDYSEGASLKPLLSSPDKEWKKAVFSRQPRGLTCNPIGYSMRTKRYRYTVWQDIETEEIIDRELYDLVADPFEKKNIAFTPGNETLIDELHAQYLRGWKLALPDGIVNRSSNPVGPPPYAWGPEGISRRAKWHEVYGGKEEDSWEKATEMRLNATRKAKKD